MHLRTGSGGIRRRIYGGSGTTLMRSAELSACLEHMSACTVESDNGHVWRSHATGNIKQLCLREPDGRPQQ